MLEDIVTAKRMRPLRICLFILFLIAPLSGYAQMDYDNGSEVFTFHKGGIPVLLYHDAECTNPGAIILPFYQEYMYIMGDMAGAIVHIHRDRELSFELEADGMYLYIKKGDVAINTRNYDGASLLIYKDHYRSSESYNVGTNERTLQVYGFYDVWMLVHVDYEGATIQGWLPPEMICGNPFTPCC